MEKNTRSMTWEEEQEWVRSLTPDEYAAYSAGKNAERLEIFEKCGHKNKIVDEDGDTYCPNCNFYLED